MRAKPPGKTIRKAGAALPLLYFALHAAAWGESAKSFYKKGQKAELRNDLETAFEDYSLALKKSPAEIQYKIALEHVRFQAAEKHIQLAERLEKAGNLKEALVEYFRALEIDPGNALASQGAQKDREMLAAKDDPKQATEDEAPNAEDLDRPGPPVHLDPMTRERVTLHMTEQSDVLYRTIGRLGGITVMIDPEFVPKRVTLDLNDTTVTEALRVLSHLSHSFWKPSAHNAIYVAPDSRAKRQQLEQMAVRTFYLSNAAQQTDINDIVTTLRNVLTAAKMFAVQGENAIVVRGSPDEILLAKSLIASLDLPKPEVLVDVYVMEVSRDKLRNIGISPPTSLSVSSSSTATLNQIGRTSSYSYSIGSAALELLLTDSESRVLENPSIRAVDGQKASLKIGEKIPVATGSYTTATSTTTSAVQTQFQYIDVGVAVDLTPTIHEDQDVTLKLAVEVSTELTQQVIDGVTEPVIGQEKAEQVVRLKDGEVSILAGLEKTDITRSVSGTPGLGELPGVKYLFSTQQNENVGDELIFLIVPHIVRGLSVHAGTAREIDTGTGDAVQLERIPPSPPAKKP